MDKKIEMIEQIGIAKTRISQHTINHIAFMGETNIKENLSQEIYNFGVYINP